MKDHFEVELAFWRMPECLRDPEKQPKINPINPAAILFSMPGAKALRDTLGEALLQLQILEFACLESARWIRRWRCEVHNDDVPVFEPSEPTWNQAILEIGAALDRRNESTRNLIARLHVARKFRNRLSHELIADPTQFQYLFSSGGRAKLVDQIQNANAPVHELIMTCYTIWKVFMCDLGVTDEVIEDMDVDVGITIDDIRDLMRGDIDTSDKKPNKP